MQGKNKGCRSLWSNMSVLYTTPEDRGKDVEPTHADVFNSIHDAKCWNTANLVFFYNSESSVVFGLWMLNGGLAVVSVLCLRSAGSCKLVFFARPRNFPFSKLTRNLHLMDKFKCSEKASSCIFVTLAHIILISNQGNLKSSVLLFQG